jgi:hypothetical protein
MIIFLPTTHVEENIFELLSVMLMSAANAMQTSLEKIWIGRFNTPRSIRES